MKSVVFTFLLFVFFGLGNLPAQTTPREPSFGDMFQQMQQMMEQLRNGGGMSFSFPEELQADSLGNGFFFRFDTTMSFGNDLFRNMPNPQGEGMYGMQDFFRQFENMGRMFGIPEDIDDGDSRTENDLLPEEQLRQSEDGGQQPKSEQPAPNPKSAPKKTEPTRKTIRI